MDKGKACWVNSLAIDYWYWQRNYHSFLSILFAPRHHPFARIYRVLVFFCAFVVSIFFSVISTLLYDELSLLISIISGVFITLMSSSMQFFALCLNHPKLSLKNKRNRSNDSKTATLASIFRFIGVFGIFGWIMFALFIFICAILFSYFWDDEYLNTMFAINLFRNLFVLDTLRSLIVSWLWSLALQTLFFLYYWRLEKSFKSNKKLKKAGGYYVTYIDYIKWRYHKE